MSAPAVELAEHAQRRHVAKGEDIVIGVLQSRPVIEHQQNTGYRFDQEKEERDAAHAPGVTKSNAALPYRYRVQMKENIRPHHDHPVAPVARRWMAEDTLPYLRAAN